MREKKYQIIIIIINLKRKKIFMCIGVDPCGGEAPGGELIF